MPEQRYECDPLVETRLQAAAALTDSQYEESRGRQGQWWLRAEDEVFVPIGAHPGNKPLALDHPLPPGRYTLGVGKHRQEIVVGETTEEPEGPEPAEARQDNRASETEAAQQDIITVLSSTPAARQQQGQPVEAPQTVAGPPVTPSPTEAAQPVAGQAEEEGVFAIDPSAKAVLSPDYQGEDATPDSLEIPIAPEAEAALSGDYLNLDCPDPEPVEVEVEVEAPSDSAGAAEVDVDVEVEGGEGQDDSPAAPEVEVEVEVEAPSDSAEGAEVDVDVDVEVEGQEQGASQDSPEASTEATPDPAPRRRRGAPAGDMDGEPAQNNLLRSRQEGGPQVPGASAEAPPQLRQGDANRGAFPRMRPPSPKTKPLREHPANGSGKKPGPHQRRSGRGRGIPKVRPRYAPK